MAHPTLLDMEEGLRLERGEGGGMERKGGGVRIFYLMKICFAGQKGTHYIGHLIRSDALKQDSAEAPPTMNFFSFCHTKSSRILDGMGVR